MKLNQQEKIYQIALSNIQGVGAVLFKQLLERFGSAENVFANSKEVSRLPHIRKTIISSLVEKDTVSIAEKLLEQQMQKNIQVVCYGEASYPTRLREIPNAPPILYCSNKIDFNLSKVISIVGSRSATLYGRDMVRKLVEGLSVYDDLLLVSGLAQGIDICAHKSAIQYNLPTIGVMAGGIDVIYPLQHTEIALQMMKKGSIISEQAVGVSPDKHHFPIRNRIIAGMADACIIVEAGQKSGALITAAFANEYNREVFAVPGCVGKTYSEGCNDLIKQHQAHLLTGIDDLAYIMNWSEASKKQQHKLIRYNNLQLTEGEKYTVETLAKLGYFVDIEFLSEKTQIATDKLSAIVLELELKNVVELGAGNKYRLKMI